MKRVLIIIGLLMIGGWLEAQVPELQNRYPVLGVKDHLLVISRPSDSLLTDSVSIKIVRPVNGGEILLATAEIDTLTSRFCRLIVYDSLYILFWVGDIAVFEYPPEPLPPDTVALAAEQDADSAQTKPDRAAVENRIAATVASPQPPEALSAAAQDSLTLLLEALDTAKAASSPEIEPPPIDPAPIFSRLLSDRPHVNLALFSGYGYTRPDFWVDYQRSLVRSHNGYMPLGIGLWYGGSTWQIGVEATRTASAIDYKLKDYYSGEALWSEEVSSRRYGLVLRWMNRVLGYRAYARVGLGLYQGSYRISFTEQFFQANPELQGELPPEAKLPFKKAIGADFGFGVSRQGGFLEVIYHFVKQSLDGVLPGGVVVKGIGFDHFSFRVGYQFSIL